MTPTKPAGCFLQLMGAGVLMAAFFGGMGDRLSLKNAAIVLVIGLALLYAGRIRVPKSEKSETPPERGLWPIENNEEEEDK